MPQNKRESLVYSVIMCFCMVLWMSIYNVALQHGGLSLEVVQQAWLGFPIAYIFAFCCDWFFVSKLAKGVAFGFLLRPDSSVRRKVITISSCMVVPGRPIPPTKGTKTHLCEAHSFFALAMFRIVDPIETPI